MYYPSMQPPVIPTIGAAPPQGYNPGAAADAMDKKTAERNRPAGVLAGAGLGMVGGALAGGVGSGYLTYALLPKGIGTGWRSGLGVAVGLLLGAPVGAAAGTVIGASLGL